MKHFGLEQMGMKTILLFETNLNSSAFVYSGLFIFNFVFVFVAVKVGPNKFVFRGFL